MGTLTCEERRRIFRARQEASRQDLARLSAPISAPDSDPARTRVATVVAAAMIIALLGTGVFAYRVVDFHVPASIDDVLPQR